MGKEIGWCWGLGPRVGAVGSVDVHVGGVVLLSGPVASQDLLVGSGDVCSKPDWYALGLGVLASDLCAER